MTDEQDKHILALARGMYSNLGFTLPPGPCVFTLTYPQFDIVFSRDRDERVRVVIRSNERITTHSDEDQLQSLVNLQTTNHVYDEGLKDVLQLWHDAHLALTLRLHKAKEMTS